jgi:hypothetical protein
VLRDKEAVAQKASIESRELELELSEAKRAAVANPTGSSHASHAAAAQAAVYAAQAERDAALFELKAARAVANEQSHERARMP